MDKYIYIPIWSNIFDNLDKLILKSGQIYFAIFTNIFCNYSADTTWITKTGHSTQWSGTSWNQDLVVRWNTNYIIITWKCIIFRCDSSEWVSDSFRLEIAIASPSFVKIFLITSQWLGSASFLWQFPMLRSVILIWSQRVQINWTNLIFINTKPSSRSPYRQNENDQLLI